MVCRKDNRDGRAERRRSIAANVGPGETFVNGDRHPHNTGEC